MLRNIIFDWSGTLIDDLPAVWAATNHVLERAGVETFTLERFRAEFSLPFQAFYQRVAPHVPLPQLETWFHAKFHEEQHTVRELPHAREFLQFCRREGLRTFVLSTIRRDHFAAQSARAGFGEYIHRPYVEAYDKKQWIHALLSENSLDPEETLFIGDMEHDVETAHHAGVRSCAVLTGYNDLQQLRRARPQLIVEHLGELKRLLERDGMSFPPIADRASVNATPVSTVGGLIFDGAGRVLMIQTHKWSDLWGIPGGKIQFGEVAEDALVRELKEETDLDISEIRFVLVQDCIHSTEFYRDAHFVLLNYVCRLAAESPVRLNHEAQAFRWVSLEDALAMPLNQPTRRLITHVMSELSPTFHG
ncbi:MAG: NUDIX domain-containing protein [Verrucomicrobia bacterium]|nr:NUDIX domain-containing protein [Verrucomicrobiota bacterium]MBI3870187.1 NUDIX domain-containing protein [Verrucomicrobiota bacterium]